MALTIRQRRQGRGKAQVVWSRSYFDVESCYGQPATDHHDIIPDGYNIGRYVARTSLVFA